MTYHLVSLFNDHPFYLLKVTMRLTKAFIVLVNVLTWNVNKNFVNLPMKDLNKTAEFFTKLGFTFNTQFTNESATCTIVSEDIFVIPLKAEKKMDHMTNKVIEAGGMESWEPQDHGWMYGRSFQDID